MSYLKLSTVVLALVAISSFPEASSGILPTLLPTISDLTAECIPVLNLFEKDEEQNVALIRKACQMIDKSKCSLIETKTITTILTVAGQEFDERELQAIIAESDVENTGKVDFDEFCNIVDIFLDEEYVADTMQDAFRIYDHDNTGYITISDLKEILQALDDKLSSSDIDDIIAEVDADGTGTVDINEILALQTGD